MSAPDSLTVTAASSIINPLASPSLIVDHDVDRRVNFVIVVDSAVLASPDDPPETQKALPEDSGLGEPQDEKPASGGVAEALENLAGEAELDDVEVVEPEPSSVAATLSDTARRPIVLDDLKPGDCRYPVGNVETVGEFSTRTQITFCAEPVAPGSRSWCSDHRKLTHAALKSSQTLRQETIARKLSRLAILAGVKHE